jgi:hypothetical protein
MGYKEDFKRKELEHELYWEERELEMEAKKRAFERRKKEEEERLKKLHQEKSV